MLDRLRLRLDDTDTCRNVLEHFDALPRGVTLKATVEGGLGVFVRLRSFLLCLELTTLARSVSLVLPQPLISRIING